MPASKLLAWLPGAHSFARIEMHHDHPHPSCAMNANAGRAGRCSGNQAHLLKFVEGQLLVWSLLSPDVLESLLRC